MINKIIVSVSDEPETLSGTHREIDSAVEDFAAEEAEIAAELSAAERARRDERNAAHNNARREQPCPDRRLEKITKKVVSSQFVENYSRLPLL